MDDNLAGLAQLLAPPGWALLAGLPPYDEAAALALGEAMRRKGIDPALAAAALTQSRLRAKGSEKFGEFAAGMLFTATGLEQATRLSVAAHHAQRFATAAVTHVADLGCGIGGDAMAMAALGLRVFAIERDEATAAIARVNLRHFPHTTVVHGDALTYDLPDDIDGLWADPARRTGQKRVFNPAAYTPPLDQILNLRHRVAALGVKVAPGIPHDAVPADAEAQWVSVGGRVVEAALWFGPLRRPNISRSALVITDAGAHHVVDSHPVPGESPETNDRRGATDSSASDQAPTGPLGAYLFEPDGAVIRAHLVNAVAREVGGHLIDPSIAYVTSNSDARSPVATRYRVLDVMPFALKTLRSYLRERNVGAITIKKRGTAITPEELRPRLDLRGSEAATVVLTRIAGKQHVIVVAPDEPPAP